MAKSVVAFVLLMLVTCVCFAQVGASGQQVSGTDQPCFFATYAVNKSTGCQATPSQAMQVAAAGLSRDDLGKTGVSYRSRVTYSVMSSPSISQGQADNGTFQVETCGQYRESAGPPERWGEVSCSTSTAQQWVVGGAAEWKCPPNAADGSGSGFNRTCWCNAGTKPNADKTACEKDCRANQTLSSGFYDIGASSGAAPAVLGCKGGCEVVFDGSSPEGSAIVNGQKHWFAKGSYMSSGRACPAGKKEDSDFLNAGASDKLPEDTCATGESKGSLNGKTVCYTETPGTETGKQTDGSKDKSGATTVTERGTNPDGGTWEKTTTSAIDRDGNKTTTTSTTVTGADGRSTTTTQTVYDGGPPKSSDGEEPDPEETECQKNPSGKDCGGSPAAVSAMYAQRDGTKDFKTVLQGAADSLSGSEFGRAVTSFFTVGGGGSCPTFSGTVPYFNASFTFDAFCTSMGSTAFLVIRTVLLLVASFFAFRVAME